MFHQGHYNHLLGAFLLSCMILLSLGCKKERFDVTIAFVVNTGEFNDGGCSWMIQIPVIPPQLLEPVNLPPSYEVDGLPIRLDYKLLDNTPVCTTLPEVEGQINIHKIEVIQ